MNTTHEPYLPALGNHRLTRHYDLVAKLAMREGAIKGRVVRRARLPAGGRLLDIGCGTGTLALLAQRRYPDGTIVGLDGDPAILAIAREKATHAGAPVQFDEGMSYALPYADGSFDAVTSTLMLHHLTANQQERTLAEVWRVLRPGGRLVVADIAPPHNWLMALATAVRERLIHRHGAGADGHGSHGGHGEHQAHGSHGNHGGHGTEKIAALLAARGWRVSASPAQHMTLAGTVAVVTAMRPARDTEAGITSKARMPQASE